MVHETWRGLDGRLVFDCHVNREPGDGVPTVVSIRSRSSPREEHQVFVTAQACVFKVRFSGGCHARGWIRQQTPIHIDDVLCTALFADMHYGCGPDDEHHFEGVMVAVPVHAAPAPPLPPGPPLPPFPPPSPWPPTPLPIPPLAPELAGGPSLLGGSSQELFPYLYVRRWPQMSAQDALWNFMAYVPSSPPASAFYGDLIRARTQGRLAAQDLALAFVDGEPPYAGEFLSSLDLLDCPVQDFPALQERLWHTELPPEAWALALQADLAALLQRWGLPWDYLRSPAYAQALDRVWQSYFALVILLGDLPALLESLVRCLLVAHAVDRVQTAAPSGSPPECASPLSRAQQLSLLNATVALPAAVFPLPPAPLGPSSPPQDAPGWIEPYAIGELQRVRQRLLRYQAGEVARIEQVMRGERRELVSRQTHREVEESRHGSNEQLLLGNAAEDGRSSLQEQARQAVAEASLTQQYNKFTSAYGPPTQATLDGSWTQSVQPGSTPGVEDAVRFAREILSRTVHRIQRSVSLLRSSSRMSQSEDTVSSVLDNTHGAGPLRAVYRWVNKVYEACVVNEGQRLMIECMVSRPAAGYLLAEAALNGMDDLRPVPPRCLGILSFEDVDRDNYARLAARYGVTEMPVPPAALRTAGASLRGGQQALVALPEGYRAVRASVRCLGASLPTVVVGCRAFPAGGPSQAAMAEEDGSVPVVVGEADPQASPPSDESVQVIVEIACEPGPPLMDAWRMAVHARLMAGYQAQLEAYRRRTGSGPLPGPRSPLACRLIEQREIKRACLRLLLDRMQRLTGGAWSSPDGSPPSEMQVNEPRYVQFLDEALEWGEMSYTFHASPRPCDADPAELPLDDEDTQFAAFLQAGQARVLLPVRPHRVMAFLYFCSSGMVWLGSDRLVPADPADLPLVNDLKHGALQRPPQRRVGPAWEVLVPTSLQWLEEGEDWRAPAGDAGVRPAAALLPTDASEAQR
ncbi:hypothetical protein ACS5PK_11080 [Roseateles sp. DB2]|uniref:hypothetical protein n=1 Tax=Roseateles sp. DB2 TaxID=3453717 RepID=UPI003EEE5E04